MMYEELVKRLKQTWEICGWYDLKEAAETIEKLQSDCADRNRWKQIAEVQDKRIDELESKMHDSFTEHLLNQISRKEKQIDGLKAGKSKLEKELEQVKAERETYKMFFDDVTGKPDCNDCGRFECEYKPKVGETTRFNCPLWRGVQGGKDD